MLGLMAMRIGKIESATEQLSWAIRLLVDHQAPIPAITLAGAAEEMLGQAAGTESSLNDLKSHFGPRYSIPQSILTQQHLNRAKNWLKHWSPGIDEEYTDFDLEEEATQYIARGLSNLSVLRKPLPSEEPKFMNWVGTRRPRNEA